MTDFRRDVLRTNQPTAIRCRYGSEQSLTWRNWPRVSVARDPECRHASTKIHNLERRVPKMCSLRPQIKKKQEIADQDPSPVLAAISFPRKDGFRLEPVNNTRRITKTVLIIGVGQWIGITGQDPIQLDRSNGEIVVNVNIQTTTEGHGEGMLSSSSANSPSARNDRFAQIGVAV